MDKLGRHVELMRAAAIALALLVLPFVVSTAHAAELELPVPRATIYPGELIGEENVVERAFIAHTVARATVYEARQAVVGKVARRTLLQGLPIPIAGTRDPYVVAQGNMALVVFETAGLTITTNAMALQNGGVGDVVTLRNVDSGAIIRGAVAADGTVRLGAP
jgi:flagellar basal body P-ring formation protein FlgA